MQIPKGIIVRQLDKYAHLLNPYTGDIISLHKSDFKSLENVKEKEIDSEIIQALHLPRDKKICSRNFRAKLVDLGASYRFPTIVNIEITRRCLLDCKHCYISSQEHTSIEIKGVENMTRKEVDKLMRDLHRMGVFLVVLTGGEPMISRNFSYFLEASKKYNMIVEIFSCLQILPKSVITQEENNIGRFQVSIYSLKGSIHDSITNRRGSLENSLKNIKVLKEKGFYIEIATPLMNINYKERNNIKKYFKKIGIAQDFSWPIFNEYYTERTNKSELNITNEEFLQFVKENPSFLFKCSYPNQENSPCVAGNSVFSIAADGSVFPCSQFPMQIGNIFTKGENIKEIYDGPNMDKVRRYRVKDIKENTDIYNFCMGNNFSETGDPLKQPLFIKDSINYCLKNLKRKEV